MAPLLGLAPSGARDLGRDGGDPDDAGGAAGTRDRVLSATAIPRALSPPDDAGLARLWAVLPEARLVGGAVRDLLCGMLPADLDLATPEPPASVIERLAAAGIKSVPTGIAHGTVTAVIDRRPYEVTTLRRDVRTDGRWAETAWTGDWHEDAARRDFTINAMSLDREGGLHDFFGGREDLEAGRLRFVGEAARRIEEDHLRILRFFRFQARFGRGAVDAEAVAAIAGGAGLVRRLSAERVWGETRRILSGPRRAATVALMERLGVLAEVFAEGFDRTRLVALDRLGPARAAADPILAAAALLRDEAGGAGLAERLRLSGEERRRLLGFLGGPAPSPDEGEGRWLALLADVAADILVGRSRLVEAAGRGGMTHASAWTAMRARLVALPRPVFPLAGRDAVRLGAAPGPAIGEALADVRRWWLAQGTRPDRAQCREALARRLAGYPIDAPAD